MSPYLRIIYIYFSRSCQANIVIANNTEKRLTGNYEWGQCHIVTNVSVIINEEYAKQPIGPFVERVARDMCDMSAMNGVRSAVICLGWVRGGSARTEYWCQFCYKVETSRLLVSFSGK